VGVIIADISELTGTVALSEAATALSTSVIRDTATAQLRPHHSATSHAVSPSLLLLLLLLKYVAEALNRA
jgi:hypothetical protein